MLKSAISTTLFEEFLSSYQNYNPPNKEYGSRPYVYVDPEGNIKLLTGMVESDGHSEGIFAVSVAEDGWMEYLALQG